LISTYAYFKHASVFGWMGAMSPAYWPGNGAIYESVKRLPGKPGRVYLDNGAGENSAQRMANFLMTLKGYSQDRDLVYRVDPGGYHDEASWARRLPDAMRFLLAPLRR
jgi:predicted alpha/beta superfamily hydrolase